MPRGSGCDCRGLADGRVSGYGTACSGPGDSRRSACAYAIRGPKPSPASAASPIHVPGMGMLSPNATYPATTGVILNVDIDMPTTHDAFSFNITFRHGNEDPATISAALKIAPSFSWAAGQVTSVGVHKHMLWEGTLAQGSGPDNFDNALRAITVILEKHQAYFRELIASGGKMEITGNFHIDPSILSTADGDADSHTESKLFEMALHPEFLASLSAIPLALRLQIWG